MATREQLIEDFADHKYATGEKFARLINSMKVVQEPVADPAASGTSLSFIDSIEQDADGKITATKKTLDLSNAHELNPFKGWWKTGDTLPTSGFDGAYLYFKDTTQSPAVTTIYQWNGTTYADTGTVVDESNVQTFGSGQQVNAVKIKDENGEEVTGPADVLSAEAGEKMSLKSFSMVEGIYGLPSPTASEFIGKNSLYGLTDYIPVTEGDTIVWHYGTAELRVFSIIVFNANKEYANYYRNTVETGEREISEFSYTGYIRASFVIADKAECFVSINGTKVWSGNDHLSERMTWLESQVIPPDSTINAGSNKLVSNKVVAENIFRKFPFSYIEGKALRLDNAIINVDSRCVTEFIDLGATSTIIYTRAITNTAGISGGAGALFYDEQTAPINDSGIPELINQAVGGYVLHKVQVPEGAKYVRFTFWKSPRYGIFWFADGDRDATAKKLYESKDSEELQSLINTNIIPSAQDIELADFLVNGHVIDGGSWQEYGSGYMIPVTTEDVFYVRAKSSTLRIYVEFLTSDTMSGDAQRAQDRITSIDTEKWIRIDIPNGCNYLFITRTFATNYDHTPDIKGFYHSDTDIDVTALQVGTFNSSYNEEDTEPIRRKFSGLLRGKDTIETFLFFTDPHLNDYNRQEGEQIGSTNYHHLSEQIRDKYISVLQKYYNSLPLDYCICGGDWINYNKSYDEACEALGYPDAYMRKLFKNYIPVMGNHDDNPYNWGQGLYQLSQNSVNNLMFRENGEEYYSYDGLNTKFYIMNTGASFTYTMSNYRWQQVAWFANKLLTDNPAHAIIFTHILSNGRLGGANSSYPTWRNGVHQMAVNLIDIAVAFNNRESITKNGITYDFSGATGRVEGYWVGHTHADMVDTAYEIPVIVTTNLQGGEYADKINYQNHSYKLIPTFDNCLVDYGNHRIHLVRVGAGVDRTVNTVPKAISVGGTIDLTPSIDGDSFNWVVESRDPNTTETLPTIITVSNGTVTGASEGVTGIRAINSNGEEEYWIIKVS